MDFDDEDDVDIDDLFPVQITSSLFSEGVTYYGWTEQSFDPTTGAYEDAPGGRSGDTSAGPFLVELNNLSVPVPSYQWARLRGIVNGDLYYEFIGKATITYVSDVCRVEEGHVILNTCTMPTTCEELATFIQSYIPVYQTYHTTLDLATGLSTTACISDEVCTTLCDGSGSGSGGGGTTCCGGLGIGYQVCLTLSGGSGNCSCMDGTWVLTQELDGIHWVSNGICSSCAHCAQLEIQLECQPDKWFLFVICHGPEGSGTTEWQWQITDLPQCLPLTFGSDTAITVGSGSLCCDPGNSLTATVSDISDCGGGGGPVSTPCCVSGMPTTVHLTLANVSGCACMAGTYAVPYDAMEGIWFGSFPGTCGGSLFTISLMCQQTPQGAKWQLQVNCTIGSSSTVTFVWGMKPPTCLPLDFGDAVGSASGSGSPCCTGTLAATVTA